MRPVTIDVAWSLCVCLLDTTMSHAKTDESSRCYLGCEIELAQATMPCPSRPVQRGLCVCCVYTTVNYAKTDKPSRCHVGCDIGDKCPIYCAVDGDHMLSCIETVDLIEIPVGVWSWMRPKNHVWWGLARTAM